MPVLNPQSDALFDLSEARARAAAGMTRFGRPAASVVALALALMLGWHVVNGHHGLTTWSQKRAEDRKLRQEIDELTRENEALRVHVQRLSGDSDAIAHEVRDKLQYVGPGEVVFKLPPKSEKAAQPVAK
jgi:cell division protein FtsB